MTHQGKNPGSERCVVAAAAFLCVFLYGIAAHAQATPPGTTSAPVVDSSTTGPMAPPHNPPATDAATESSPSTRAPHGLSVPAHALVEVRLLKTIDSAHVRNGDMVDATLVAPVRATDGRTLAAGTRVGLTVLAVAAAGKISSHGEITLQVTHVGPAAALTDALTFRGEAGHKDLPDSAPAKGTEATVAANTTLQFHVAPIPK